MGLCFRGLTHRKTTDFRQLKTNPPGNFEGLGLEPQFPGLFGPRS